MSRRFAAVGVPAPVRDALEAAVAPVRERSTDLAWSDPAGWHLTLAFLGELADDRLPEARRAVEEAVAGWREAAGLAEVSLRLGGAGRFGHRVLHVEVVDEPPGALADLGAHVQAALAGADLPVDRREVRPHVTLARARRRSRVTDDVVGEVEAAWPGVRETPDAASSLDPSADRPGASAAAWSVDRVAIWSAQDRRGPARYVVDVEVPLGPR